jgi:hypothetical protein
MNTGNYRYSYSGADSRVFCQVHNVPESLVELDTLNTISVSIHEDKRAARALGYRSPKGFARGVRTIAGSMILTVIEDHPLRAIMDKCGSLGLWSPGWSMDEEMVGVGSYGNIYNFNNRLPTLLPPLDFFIIYHAEAAAFVAQRFDPPLIEGRTISPRKGFNFGNEIVLGKGNPIYAQETRLDFNTAGVAIEKIDFIDVGMVTSVNDIVTEMTVSYQALDHRPISLNTITEEGTFQMRERFENLDSYNLRKSLFPLEGEAGAGDDVAWDPNKAQFIVKGGREAKKKHNYGR